MTLRERFSASRRKPGIGNRERVRNPTWVRFIEGAYCASRTVGRIAVIPVRASDIKDCPARSARTNAMHKLAAF